MNKYRRFKYPFGGETPEEFADARRAYYENVSNDAYQQIASGSTPNNIKHIEPNIPGVKDYIERTGQEVTDYINRNYNNQPSARKGKLIRNHDKLYDYYKDGDKLYYRKKGGKNWIDISDNDVAQKRINATIARNKRSYGKPNNSSSESVKDNKTYDAGTLNDVVVTGNRSNNSSIPKRVQGSTAYKSDAINDIVKNAIYGKKPQFTPSKVKPSSIPTRNVKSQDRRLTEPKTRPYTYHGGRKYNIYTDGKGNWIE